MKRTLFLTIVISTLLCIGKTNAQTVDTVAKSKDSVAKVTFGIKAGAIFNQIIGNSTFQKSYTTGLFGGASIESVKKKWGIQAEALFNSARYNLLNDTIQNNAYFSIIFVNVLALPEYEVIPHLWLQAGLEFSSFLSLSRTPSESIDPKNYFQPRDFSGVIGVEAKLPVHFTVGARYALGLSNIKSDYLTNTTTPESWKTRSAMVYLGYRFQ